MLVRLAWLKTQVSLQAFAEMPRSVFLRSQNWLYELSDEGFEVIRLLSPKRTKK